MRRLRPYVSLQQGFTLVELLVVITIIGVLVAIAVPSYLGYRGRATDRVAQSDLRAAIPSAEAYAADHDGYSGLDLAAMRSNDAGLASSIDHVAVSGTGSGYCIGATVDGTSWSVKGPGATQWYRSDNCATGTETMP